MRGIFRQLTPDKLVLAVFGFLIGIVTNLVSDFFPQLGQTAILLLMAITAIIGIVVLAIRARAQRVRVVINRFVTLRLPEEREREARRGLIVFVSLYSEVKRKPEERLPPEAALAAAKNLDYGKLSFEVSNLQPAIEAIVSHRSRLDYCWLISTTASDPAAAVSLPYAPVLCRYLTAERGVDCTFFGDKDSRYAVPLDDDGEVTIKTRDIVARIFKEASELGLKEDDIVADFTGGLRSMTLGMILACLDRGRDIQFQGTHYDENGKQQDLFPLLFDFGVEIMPD